MTAPLSPTPALAYHERARLIWESGLPTLDTVLLQAISDHLGRNAEAWPSQERLAYMTRLTTRAVRQHTRALEVAGVLLVDVGGGRSSTHYAIRWEVLALLAAARSPEPHSAHPGTTFRPPRNNVPPCPEPRSAVTDQGTDQRSDPSNRPTTEDPVSGTTADQEAASAIPADGSEVGRTDGSLDRIWTSSSPVREALPSSIAQPLLAAGLPTLGAIARYSRDEIYTLTGSGPLLRRELDTIRARLRDAGLLLDRRDWDQQIRAAAPPADAAGASAWGLVRAAIRRYGGSRRPGVDFDFGPADALVGGALLGEGGRSWGEVCRLSERDLEREVRPWFLARYAERAARVTA